MKKDLAERKLVMVVEDDPSLRELLSYNLEEAGYAVAAFENVMGAEDSLKERMPDLFILDWMLPGRENGIEWCQRLRRREATKDTPIIIVTARGEPIDRELAIHVKANEYIEKPFGIQELLSIVDKYLDEEMRVIL